MKSRTSLYSWFLALLTLVFVFCSCNRANATVTVYTSRTDFLNATQPSYYLETFDSFPVGSYSSPKRNFVGNGFEFAASTDAAIVGVQGPGKDIYLAGTSILSLSALSGNATALGGYIFPTDASGVFAPGQVTLYLNGKVSATISVQSTANFIGFTSDAPVSSALFYLTGGGNNRVTANDVIMGQTLAAVPEPSTWAAMAVGALALLVGGRKQLLARQVCVEEKTRQRQA